MTRLTFSRGSIRSARFGPDGKTVVFGAAWDGAPIRLFVAQPGSPEPQRAELPDADVLSVSPSGEMALSVGRAFRSLFDASGTLARAPIGGTRPARHPRGGPRGRLGARRRDSRRREGRRREDAARDADRQGPLPDGRMDLAPARLARRDAGRLRTPPAPVGRPGLGGRRPRKEGPRSRSAGPGRASEASRGPPREKRSGTRALQRGRAGSCAPSTSRAGTGPFCACRGT